MATNDDDDDTTTGHGLAAPSVKPKSKGSLLSKVGVASQALYGLLVIAAFLGTIASLIYLRSDIPSGTREVLLVLVGVLAGAFKDVIGFTFGSSLGSQKKDETRG